MDNLDIELTQEEMDKMKALLEKYTFDDLRIFLNAKKLDLVVGKFGEILDYDLFHWNKSQAKTFSVYDNFKVEKVKRAFQDLVTTKNKAWRGFPGIERINESTRIASEFAKDNDRKLKKCVKLFELHNEDLLDEIEGYGLMYVTFTADKLTLVDCSGKILLDYSADWKKYLIKLALRQAPKFKHGLVEHNIED